jgi:hypothetical protein
MENREKNESGYDCPVDKAKHTIYLVVISNKWLKKTSQTFTL